MKNIYAINEATAEQIASDFFKKEFNHSGKVGIENRMSSTCACGESAAIEFYSKDDPGMDDTITITICENCYNEQASVDKLLNKLEILVAEKKYVAEKTCIVCDCPSNRFHFYGLLQITEEMAQSAENINEYSLAKELPEDVKRAVEIMKEEGVNIENFIDVVTYENGDTTYYLLVW